MDPITTKEPETVVYAARRAALAAGQPGELNLCVWGSVRRHAGSGVHAGTHTHPTPH